MAHNATAPHIDANPETCEVWADDMLLTCRPAESLPMAQLYSLF